jgi:putative sterol carrier protein
MTAKELLHRMPEALDSDAAGDTKAVIQYELSEPMYQVLDAGTVRTVEGRADAPDLTVTIGDDDLIALFRGKLNPVMAFMTGRVRVAGDVALAQRLVKLFDQEKLSGRA